MSAGRGLALTLLIVALVIGCTPTDRPQGQAPSSDLTPSSASKYVLPAGLGRYTNVWSADPDGAQENSPVVLIEIPHP